MALGLDGYWRLSSTYHPTTVYDAVDDGPE